MHSQEPLDIQIVNDYVVADKKIFRMNLENNWNHLKKKMLIILKYYVLCFTLKSAKNISNMIERNIYRNKFREIYIANDVFNICCHTKKFQYFRLQI